MSKGKLAKAQGVGCKLTNFPFDLKYTVTSFDIRLQVGQFPKTFTFKNTNKFDQEIREKIRKLKSGSTVSFQNIKAKGPDGIKPCPPIVFTVQ